MTKQLPSSNEMALRLLSAMLGVFFLALGLDKASWFGDSSELNRFFQNWLKSATVLNEWYLRQLAVPWISVWTRLVPLGELSVGVALLLGIVPRAAAIVSMFMVMNIHFASGALFRNSGTDERKCATCARRLTRTCNSGSPPALVCLSRVPHYSQQSTQHSAGGGWSLHAAVRQLRVFLVHHIAHGLQECVQDAAAAAASIHNSAIGL